MMFDMIFGAFTGAMFFTDVVKCAGYVIVGMIVMRLMKKTYSNILVFVPIIVLLLCAPALISYLKISLNNILEAVRQFDKVGGDSYLEPLGNALFILLHCIPVVVSPILTYLDYKKIIKESHHDVEKLHQNDEIRKMKIQDL